MPSYDPTLFNVNPYFDDFNEDKKFLRMLFRPGYAVQSRELTQLQTILQNQIERFGNNIFKDGSRIIGGEITNQTLNYVRILPSTISTPTFTVAASDLLGHNLIQRDGNSNVVAKAKVVDFIPPQSNTDLFGVAIVSYLSGNEFTASATIECDNPDKLFNVVVAPSSTTVPHKGLCRVVAVSEGIFYVNGFFIKTDSQIQSAYTVLNEVRQFNNPTGMMGFKVNSLLVTDKEDYTLKDPANGSYNYNAPGSHRYKIDLELIFTEDLEEPNFVQLVEYLNGEVVKRFDQTQYSELIKLFAQRTYDEKGNFVIKPFDISFTEKNATTINADIGSGKAYVFGHEYESQFKDSVEIPKARSSTVYQDLPVSNYFGNYIKGRYLSTANVNSPNLIKMLSMIGRQGENSLSYQVYGSATPLNNFNSTGFSGCVFTALLHKVEIDDNQNFSSMQTTGNGLTFRAYLSNIQEYGPTGSVPQGGINLYLLDPLTGGSGTHPTLLTNLTLLRDSPGQASSNSRMPLFSDFKSQELIYPANGSTPTTMVKELDKLSYVHEISRAFQVVEDQLYPEINTGLSSEYKWYIRSLADPVNKQLKIDVDDGYYIVYEGTVNNQANPLRIGTVLKVVGQEVEINNVLMPMMTSTNEGNTVRLTTQLPIGSYRLVGKVKADITDIASAEDSTKKFRKKVSTSRTETISATTPTLNTFKRTVQYVSSLNTTNDDIYELYFVLDRADVYKIDSIFSNNVDISYKFKFDTGQRDAAYLFSRLYVKPQYIGEFAPGQDFNFTVTYSYFTHSGYGPFVKQSYSNISYDEIPVYTSPTTGNSIHLANALDYRPVQKLQAFNSLNKPEFYFTNGFVPNQATVFNSHEAYLPRIDKLVISRNIAADGDTTTIQRIAGNASDTPQIPEDLNDSMTISVLCVPAYTFNPKDIKAQSVFNNRFTMTDIGGISKRVENLEQHVVLSDLEANVLSKDIKKSDGSDAIKRAILVDTFNGHSVADVVNDDHRCSIDVEQGELRPLFESHAYDFIYSGGDSGLTLTGDNILCESYSRYADPIVEQAKASNTIKVNPFGFPNWVGCMKLSPHADFWYEKAARPVIKNNDTGINDAWLVTNMNSSYGHGSQWNDWESIWTGLSVELTEGEERKNALFFAKPRNKDPRYPMENRWVSKEGISRESSSFDVLKDVYKTDFRKKEYYVNASTNTVVNRSVVPYVRDNTVTFSAYNLKPNTIVHVFMDNVNMNQYCSYNGVTGGPFLTNQLNGSLENVTMNIPSGVFEVGDKIVRVVDSATNDIANATTIAENVFYVEGLKNQNVFGIESVRQPEIRKQTPNSNKVIATPLYRSKSINTTKYNKWIDPLAQTFRISEDIYPNGLFAESIDLYIATADVDLPISIELCPVINGVPHTSIILPFSSVVKTPSQLNVDSNSPVATTFKFSTPVFLSPGEYAVLIRTNSQRYSLFVARVGETDIVTDDRISSTLQSGSLFTSQNSSEMTGNANTDLMFKLYRCNFNTTNTRNFVLNHGFTGESIEAALVQPNLFAFTPNNVSLVYNLNLGSRTYPVTNSKNLDLINPLTITSSAIVQYQLTTYNSSNGMATFMIDLDRTNLVAVQYIVTERESSIVETAPIPANPRRRRRKRRRRNVTYTTLVDLVEDNPTIPSVISDSTSRYISKYVVIPNNSYASELKVYFDANIPRNAVVSVFAKAFDSTQNSIDPDMQPYSRMDVDPSSEFLVGGQIVYSTNEYDFKEAAYTLVPTGNFNTFLVKICMYSTDKIDIPVIKNLRVVALA